ncbi:MAG: alpha-L-rhamnosidase-related protein [Acidobacteriaceae bacterium]
MRCVRLLSLLVLVCGGFCITNGWAQKSDIPEGSLDPTRSLPASAELSGKHVPLPEQYIWTAGDTAALQADAAHYSFANQKQKIAPHYFRYSFMVEHVPASATLYVAGPRSAKMYLNGKLVDQVQSDLSSPLGIHVFATDVTGALHTGRNTVALEVVRGRGIVAVTQSLVLKQLTYGEVLVAKIVPAAIGVDAPALAMSGPAWKSTLHAVPGWEQPNFDDSTWKPVQSLGSIESSVNMYQWNADAGLYNWPGYEGISSYLRQFHLKAEQVTDVFEGRSRFEYLQALTSQKPANTGTPEFTVMPSQMLLPDESAPSLLLDFGREVAGRIELQSDCDCSALVTIEYGESEDEAKAGGHYLGTQLLHIPPHGTAYGPKSGFRYVKLRFLGGASRIPFKAIQLDGIYYPVQYKGTFESSDPLLNRIWETGAYTMHLCMQDDIWDAVKRDRGRWVGDLDVGGRVVNDVFADRFLMQDTMTRLIGSSPVTDQVNGIPGYSSLWITSLADYYLHTGDKSYLQQMHGRILELLQVMDAGFNTDNLFVNPKKQWLFVDWSPRLYGDTPEARIATQMEYYRAYREAASLLDAVGDSSNAEHYRQRAQAIKAAAETHFYDPQTGTYGDRWQTNAMAIFSGMAPAKQYPLIWKQVLAHVEQDEPTAQTISPYFNYYVIAAMAETGHREAALQWVRTYWGGMLAEGATSFWEAYDLRWPKHHFHTSLQADGTSGFFVSLAHGWSSGPTAWLMEQVLGIQPTAAGFRSVTIRPDLLDLKWVKGSEPTPHGLIQEEVSDQQGWKLNLDLPSAVDARVLVPVSHIGDQVYVNGIAVQSTSAEMGQRAAILLHHAGHYEIHVSDGVASK